MDPRAERGAVAVIVAFMLPALLAMAALVLDVANQWVHKRHLQSQADAAALAGAQLLRAPCNATIEAQVATEVDKYAGATTSVGLAGTPSTVHFNNQLDVPQGNEQVLGLLNSPTYPDNQGGPNNGEANSGHPCADHAVDVKLTDKSVPFLAAGGIPVLSSALSSFGHINVHARVAIKQANQAKGLLPFAVSDPTPQQVQARLYSDSGTALGGTDVTPIKMAPGASDPYTFTGQFTGTLPGTRYAAANVQLMTSGGSAPISSGCTGALEQCLPPVGNAATGLVQSRVWAATGATPGTNDVALFYNTQLGPSGVPGCGNDGYFARVTTANCATNFTVSVDADFQSGVTLPTAGAAPRSSDHAIVCIGTSTSGWLKSPPNGGGACGNGGIQLQYKGPDPSSTPSHGLWTGSVGGVSTETGPGGATFVSLWAVTDQGSVNGTGCTNGKPCTSPIIDAQQFFSGTSALSGSADSVSIVPNSRQPCAGCSTTFTITAHFKALQPAQSPTDPKFFLRVGTGQSNQGIDCTPSSGGTTNFESQIAGGCPVPFRVWTSSDPVCNPNAQMSYTYMQGPPVNAPPYPCANVNTGVTAGQVGSGMQERVFCGGFPGTAGSSCPNKGSVPTTCPDQYRNHWPSDPSATLPDFQQFNDRRLVPVFIVPNGEFTNLPPGGTLYVPVETFGLFYVTGWTGQAGTKADPCADTTQPLPPGASYDDTSSNSGDVIGHFVNELDDPNLVPGSNNCDFNSITPCLAVLVD